MLPQILQQPKLLNVVTPLIYTPSAVCNRVARDWLDWREVFRWCTDLQKTKLKCSSILSWINRQSSIGRDTKWQRLF